MSTPWMVPFLFLSLCLTTAHGRFQTEDDVQIITHDRQRQHKSPSIPQDLPDEPIQLVKPDSEHKRLVVIEDNVQYLNLIKGPVAVIAVVGNFHSGKSFLMNQLMKKKNGFGVGPSVQPKTMGIWMWGRPARMQNSDGQQISVVFLDTEGFAANNISENYDAKVFAVSTILSSHLLFNSVKIINQADIDYLEVLARKTQLFALRSQMSKAMWVKDFSHDLLVFPPLTWVVQDFFQDLEDADNPREWLHRLMKTHTRETEEYKISLLDIFSDIDCHTLFLPATKKHLLNDLSRAREEDLTVEYREERDTLIEKLSQNLQPKRRQTLPITGAELGHLLRILVVAANEGNIASVPSRWEAFVEHLQATATEDCLKFYEDEMTNIIATQGVQGILKKTRFDSFHRQMTQKAKELMSHLLQGLSETKESGLLRLSNRIDLAYERMKDLNDKKIRLKLNEVQHSNEVQMEEELGNLRFPLPSYSFETESQSIMSNLRDNIYSFILKFVEDEEATAFMSDVLKSLTRIVENYRLRNVESVRQFFLNTIESSIARYEEVFRKEWDQKSPLKPLILNKIKEKAERETELIFVEETRDFESEQVFVIMRSHLKEQIKERDKKFDEENARLASQYIQSHATEILSHLKQRTGPDMIQMPIFDTDLDKKLEQEVNQAMKQFETATIDYSIYDSFAGHFQQFKQDISSLCDLRKKENIDAFTREVHKPLEAALRMIRLAEDKYSTVYAFRKFIRSVCLINLDDGKPRSWPLELKNQIIDNFINSNEELTNLIAKRDGIWSLIAGFLEWIIESILALLGLISE